jgi:hypothetical protein
MSRRLRPVLARLMQPMVEHLDAINRRLDVIEGRLTALSTRLDEIEDLVQRIGTRAAAQTERSLVAAESEARMARRVEEIERLLGAATDHR